MEADEIGYVLATEDFDKSLLPPNARTAGTDAFQHAVSEFYTREYKNFGGTVRVVVDPKKIAVSWRPDTTRPDPLDVAVNALKVGDYKKGVVLLELLRQQRPDSADVLYNLGMALSDMGNLDAAVQHLKHGATIAPSHVNMLVAIGVALARQKKWVEATSYLERAVEAEPENPWAQRNLGACLGKVGEPAKAESALRRAVELAPNDQQALFGLAQALKANGNEAEADKLYVRTIEVDSQSKVAELAKGERSALAQQAFRSRAPAGVRMDAVMYLLGALQKFGKMSKTEVQQVTLEIAMLGQRGLDTNSAEQKYQLRSMPGRFSGLHLLCYMHVGFQQIAPGHSIGFDLSKDYEVAMAMYDSEKGK